MSILLTEHPEPARQWMLSLWHYRQVLWMLARKDFQTRYKRAAFGLAWSVVVPLLQAAIMAVVFSRALGPQRQPHFPVFIMSGVIAFSYFNSTLGAATSSIVDGSGLTDKVWFPRSLLVFVPALSNLVGFVVSTIALLLLMPLFHAPYTAWVSLLIPAAALLVALSVALGLCLSALQVYFRDVKFLVQAALLVWVYLTPILYPQRLVRGLAPWLDFNPLTGVVTLFHAASLGGDGFRLRPVIVTLVITAVLGVAGSEGQRRYDRLFVDQL